MRFAWLSILALLMSIPAFADDHSISYDGHTDFTMLKTFAVRGGQVSSQRPELNNPIAVKRVGDAIRAELRSKGLKETTDRPDVIVDYSITSIDYSGGLFGLPGEPRRGGPLRVGSLPGDVSNSEATLVIDVNRSNPAALIWRGVYRDSESNGAKLPQKLPGDVKKLFSEYPPKRKSASATIPDLPFAIMLPCPGASLSIIAPVSAVDHMGAARLALCRASDALHKAVSSDKGGYLETSLAAVNQVLTHVHYSVAYRSSHPDSANDPPTAPTAALNFNPAPNGRGFTQMNEALAELKTAFEEFAKAPGGNLGGLRDTVNEDFAAAIRNINSGITYAARGR